MLIRDSYCFKFLGSECYISGERNKTCTDSWYKYFITGVLKSPRFDKLNWVCVCYKNISETFSDERLIWNLNISIAQFWMFLWRIETGPKFSNDVSFDDDLWL